MMYRKAKNNVYRYLYIVVKKAENLAEELVALQQLVQLIAAQEARLLARLLLPAQEARLLA